MPVFPWTCSCGHQSGCANGPMPVTVSCATSLSEARCSMNAVTRSWVRKAERDFKVAQGLLRRWVAGYGDAACFHCQQAVEKYLKARLIESGIPFPRTHDLSALLALLLS